MRAILRIIGGPNLDRSVVIEPGESVTIGRSDYADFVLPEDLQLSSRHFFVQCEGQRCQLQDLESTNGTFVNDEFVVQKLLREGDLVRAGTTTFRVALEIGWERLAVAAQAQSANGAALPSHKDVPETARSAVATPTAAAPVAGDLATCGHNNHQQAHGTAEPFGAGSDLGPARGFVSERAFDVCDRFQLAADTVPMPEPDELPEQFIERLRTEGMNPEAMNFLAFALPKRCAVWWAVRCIQSVMQGRSLSEADHAALSCASRWVAEPSEENRRAAFAAAEQLDHSTAASWAAMAAFWSGGSMGPADAPPVPPEDDMTPKAVSGAIAMAVVADPQQAEQHEQRFLDCGLAVATGEDNWDSQTLD